jgi:transcriptional regulator with XRE-family HTH domain
MIQAERVTKAQVRMICKRLGLTSQQLADRIGVSVSAVNKWRLPSSTKGSKSPGADSSAALMEIWRDMYNGNG